MRIYKLGFADIGVHRDLRCGLGVIQFRQVVNRLIGARFPSVKLGEVLSLEYGKGLTEEERTGEGYPVVGSNGIVGYHDEYLIETPCIIVGRKGSAGEVTYLDQPCFPIDTTFYVKPKTDFFQPKILFYLLRLLNLEKLALFKGVPGLNRYDAYEAQIPLIRGNIQEDILRLIEPLECEVAYLQTHLTEPTEAINRIFVRESGFNADVFYNLMLQRTFPVNLIDLANLPLLRMTTIFNKPANKYLRNFLQNNSFFDLKKILTRKIQRGKQPVYADDGVLVIKTKNIQKGLIDLSEPEFVANDFYEQNEVKVGIVQNDLLLTSTGMGRGKFALYESEEPALADSHISIIRFDSTDINPQFLNYFCQSIIGISQLKYIETQIKGTPEIYEEPLNTFRVLSTPKPRQELIVAEIQAELAKQDEIKRQIKAKQNEIDHIVEVAISLATDDAQTNH